MENRLQGHSDIALHAEGVLQAAAIARRLANSTYSPVAIYSSDLIRARVTAEAIGSALKLPVTTTADLRETGLGDWEGLTFPEITARGEADKLALYRSDAYRNRPPGAETMQQVWARMLGVVAMVRENHGAGDVILVGHGGSLKVLLCEALGGSLQTMKHVSLANTAMSVIEDVHGHTGGVFQRVLLMNDTSHLDL